MNWDEFRAAFNQAKHTLSQADSVAGDMGMLLVGRLHRCPNWVCTALKNELKRYNTHTGEWKQ